jgi:hypothetical protein
MFAHVYRPRLDAAVQTLVEQQIRSRLELPPFGERARRRAMLLGLDMIVHVSAREAAAAPRVFGEGLVEFFEQIGVGAEVAVVIVAARGGLSHFLPHFQAVPAMEGVAFDIDGVDLLTPEDLVERHLDRRGPRPRRAGDGDDGMFDRHVLTSQDARHRPRLPNSGERAAERWPSRK